MDQDPNPDDVSSLVCWFLLQADWEPLNFDLSEKYRQGPGSGAGDRTGKRPRVHLHEETSGGSFAAGLKENWHLCFERRWRGRSNTEYPCVRFFSTDWTHENECCAGDGPAG